MICDRSWCNHPEHSTIVAEFQNNKVHSKDLDMLCLTMDVVARNSRWEIQYCLEQVLKHLGYKIWNVTDPIFLRVHFYFLKNQIFWPQHVFLRLLQPDYCYKMWDRHVTGSHSHLVFFNLVIPSGGDNVYRRPRGPVVPASQVARSCGRLPSTRAGWWLSLHYLWVVL
jgi:hypothetical protein